MVMQEIMFMLEIAGGIVIAMIFLAILNNQ